MEKYIEPSLWKKSFNCPRCGAFAQQDWANHLDLHKEDEIGEIKLASAFCLACKKNSIWFESEMIYPPCRLPYTPNEDLSDEIKKDYNEAVSICQESPRGAAALLRLCVQKLCIQLGEKGENLNADIGELVKKGLPKEIQQALDIVRVFGNNAVHLGDIDINTVISLFGCINLIAEEMISQPKRTKELYDKIPDFVKKGIENRDSKSHEKNS